MGLVQAWTQASSTPLCLHPRGGRSRGRAGSAGDPSCGNVTTPLRGRISGSMRSLKDAIDEFS